MHNYWPRRKVPNGFSIESLANHCPNRINSNAPIHKGVNESNEDINSPRPLHWANRGYEEYLLK